MQSTKFVNLYSTLSETSKILNCILSYNRNIGDITVEVEENKISVQGKDIHTVFTLTDLYLYPDTCRGLKCLPEGEIHFSLKAELWSCRKVESYTDDISVSHVAASQLRLSQNDLVDKIELLQNKWYCATCQQKLLADRCILSRVLPLPSENWSDFADMWFCHKPEGQQPIKKQRFLPGPGQCFVGETYLLISGSHVKTGAIRVTKDGTLTCARCGKQLGGLMQKEDSSYCQVYKFFLHTIKIQHDMPENGVMKTVNNSNDTELFFSRLLQEQCQLYTSYRFIVEASHKNGYKNGDIRSDVLTCLVWLLDTDVLVYKSSQAEEFKSQHTIQKDNVIKLLFKCQLTSANDKRPTDYITKSLVSMWRKDNTVHSINLPHPLFLQFIQTLTKLPTDYVTKSLVSMWRKDNTVHNINLPHPVFLQFIQTLLQNCKHLSTSQRFLNGFHVSFLSKDQVTVK